MRTSQRSLFFRTCSRVTVTAAMRFSTFLAASRSEKRKVSILPGTMARRLPRKLAISLTRRGGRARDKSSSTAVASLGMMRFDLGLGIVDGQKCAVFVPGRHVGHALLQADGPQPRLPGHFDGQRQGPARRDAKVAAGNDADRLEAERAAVAGAAAAGRLPPAAIDHVDAALPAEGIDRSARRDRARRPAPARTASCRNRPSAPGRPPAGPTAVGRR